MTQSFVRVRVTLCFLMKVHRLENWCTCLHGVMANLQSPGWHPKYRSTSHPQLFRDRIQTKWGSLSAATATEGASSSGHQKLGSPPRTNDQQCPYDHRFWTPIYRIPTCAHRKHSGYWLGFPDLDSAKLFYLLCWHPKQIEKATVFRPVLFGTTDFALLRAYLTRITSGKRHLVGWSFTRHD